MGSFERLIRFKDASGSVHYGEAPSNVPLTLETLKGVSVPVYKGLDPWAPGFVLSEHHFEIEEVLCPLAATPNIICVGLNYQKHADEFGIPVGKWPILFNKPPDALAGPYEDIPIHPDCLEMDYEVELTFILREDCKDLKATDDVFKYILGYTAGNDVSSRYWQAAERSAGTPTYAKSFDKFAPIGPAIISPSIVTKPGRLTIKTTVNGEVRQLSNTDDMVFDIPAILEHASRGKTLRKGTVVMTGTPGGIAMSMKPPGWLKDGDVVEIGIENVGTIRNKMVFMK